MELDCRGVKGGRMKQGIYLKLFSFVLLSFTLTLFCMENDPRRWMQFHNDEGEESTLSPNASLEAVWPTSSGEIEHDQQLAQLRAVINEDRTLPSSVDDQLGRATTSDALVRILTQQYAQARTTVRRARSFLAVAIVFVAGAGVMVYNAQQCVCPGRGL
jgi:hypothetical protein